DVTRGDPYSLTALAMSCHTGTHIDAPAHYIAGGATVDQLPLDLLIGRAQVLDLADRRGATTLERLQGAGLGAGAERLLFKTRNSALWAQSPGRLAPDWDGLAPETARWLVARAPGGPGLRLAGIDYLSIEPPDSADFATHRTLLAASVVIVEGL